MLEHDNIPKSPKAKINYFFYMQGKKPKLRSNFTRQERWEGKDGIKETIASFSCLQRILICKTAACWKALLDIKLSIPLLETFWVKGITLVNQKGWRKWKVKSKEYSSYLPDKKEILLNEIWEMSWGFPIRSEKTLREVIKIIYFEVLLAIFPSIVFSI